MAELRKLLDDLESLETNMIFYKHKLEAKTIRDAIERLKEQHKKGHWIDGGDPCEWACSVCRYRVARHNNTPFCPNCGTDMMKGGEKNG